MAAGSGNGAVHAGADGRDVVPFVDLRAEYRTIRRLVDMAMAGVVERGDFVLGHAVESFERAFAEYCGVGHAVGVDSGFSALELSLRAAGIGDGDEVITVANTFIATVAAIQVTGARPVLVDADPQSHQIDLDQLEGAVTSATRAVIPVHLYGHMTDMARVTQIAQRHGLMVLEDACQAHGARQGGRRAGSFGHASAFSFYPSKNLGAFGDAGMIVTDDERLAERVRLLRNLGSTAKYHHEVVGYNRRLDTIQAAVLEVKLAGLDQRNTARRRLADRYAERLAGLPLATPICRADTEAVYHLFVVEADGRDDLRDWLERGGVSTGIHYPVPVHLQPATAALGYRYGDFPVAESLASRVLSLPMYPQLAPAHVDRVAEGLHAYWSEPRTSALARAASTRGSGWN